MLKNITFKGIVRSTDNLYAKDGECAELINLRITNGVAQPIAPPHILATLPRKYKAVYRHEIAGVYMCIAEEDGAVYLYDNEFNPWGESETVHLERLPLYSDVKRIEFMGNLVCFFTSTSTLYALYDTGVYRRLDERPPMPKLDFTLYPHIESVTTEYKYRSGKNTSDEDENLYWENASKGYFDECVAKLNAKGCYIDRAMFRYAFRLFDGSYSFFSPIYYVKDNTALDGLYCDKGNFVSIPQDKDATSTYYTVKVKGFAPKFNFSAFNLDAWENIIVSVDVFSSGSIPGHKVAPRKDAATDELSAPDVYLEKSNSEIFDDVSSCTQFYKVAEFNITGGLVDSLSNVSPSSLALSKEMGVESISLVSRTADYTYVLNNRLHIAGLRETFFKGYDTHCFIPLQMSSITLSGSVYVDIETTKGKAVVRRDYDKLKIGYNNGEMYIAPLLQYPDARAVRMTFFIRSVNRRYRKSFPLVRHKSLNIAYYLNTADDGLKVRVSGVFDKSVAYYVLSESNIKSFFSYRQGEYTLVYSDTGLWMYNGVPFLISSQVDAGGYYGIFNFVGVLTPGDTLTVIIEENIFGKEVKEIANIPFDASWEELLEDDTTEEQNCIEHRGNVLKVSATDNPFLFPLEQTYTPTQRNIVAVCSNTIALSQGQFGQHPLYLFCSDGIWAMATETTGTLAYSSCYPLSREVCISADSVRGIDSGVVFLSEKGLMLIEGGRITSLSALLDTVKSGVDNKGTLTRIAAIVSLEDGVCDDTFKDYCKGASVGYQYEHRELIVSNPEYPYSYIFSLANGACYKYMYTFDHISNCYPQLVTLMNDGNGTKIVMPGGDEGSNSVLLMTRPLLWGTKLHKRIMQMMLHATASPAVTECSFNGLACYLMCSNDGENFKIVAGSERRSSFSDIVFPYAPTQSYRYFAVAIVGRINCNSSLVALEFNVGTSWDNRLS